MALDQPVYEGQMLSDLDLERYARQVIMPSVGEEEIVSGDIMKWLTYYWLRSQLL